MKVESSKIFFFILVALALVTAAVENFGAVSEETGTSSHGLITPPTTTPATKTPDVSTTTTTLTTTKTVATTTTTPATTITTTTTTAVPDFPNQAPAAHLYNVTDVNGKICVLFKATIKLNFHYKMANDSSRNVTGHVYIPSVQDGTAVNGSCGLTSQSMILSFFNGWSLNLNFFMNSSINMYYLQQFKLGYDIKNGSAPFPNAEDIGSKVADLNLDGVWINNLSSYLCISSNTLKPSESVPFGLTSVEIANEEYEAFVTLDEPFFATSRVRCQLDKVSNLIPIIVGAALGGLIIIVLVVYLIGRHKSRKGYESV